MGDGSRLNPSTVKWKQEMVLAHRTVRSAYKKLSDSLNRFPQGAPPSELLFQILAMRFNEKEAELVASLPIKPFKAQTAARIWKLPVGDTLRQLNGLADRALLVDIESGPNATDITNESAVIRWETSLIAPRHSVFYAKEGFGFAEDYFEESGGGDLVHSRTLTGLEPNTTYRVKVRSCWTVCTDSLVREFTTRETVVVNETRLDPYVSFNRAGPVEQVRERKCTKVAVDCHPRIAPDAFRYKT